MAAGGGAAASAAATAHNQMVEAVLASGTIVKLEPQEFQKVLAQIDDALVVVSRGGVFTLHFKYLVSYKGWRSIPNPKHNFLCPLMRKP